MVRLSKVLAAILSILMVGPISPQSAAAQTVPDSLVTQAQIDDALLRASADEKASRDMIRGLLAREDVRLLAKNYGIGALTEKAAGLVDTLEGSDLERASGYASELTDRLAGGDTVYISIGLISLLLIIIIIILLTK